eukprot:scaffold11930_cov16-Tisochrysis_lutea.AAC.1
MQAVGEIPRLIKEKIFKKCQRLPSDRQHEYRNPTNPRIGNQEGVFAPDQSNPSLTLKVPDWRTWTYTDGSCLHKMANKKSEQ